jgi:hypothetical protein
VLLEPLRDVSFSGIEEGEGVRTSFFNASEAIILFTKKVKILRAIIVKGNAIFGNIITIEFLVRRNDNSTCTYIKIIIFHITPISKFSIQRLLLGLLLESLEII